MRLTVAAAITAAAFALSGCMAYDVASTAVSATTSVVGAGVSVASSAVCTVACSSDDEKRK